MNPEAVSRFVAELQPAFREADPLVDQKAAEERCVALVTATYQALSQGDYAALRCHLSDDVELEMAGPPESPISGRWIGRDQALEAAARNYGRLEDQHPELLSVVAQGDTVAVVARERGRIRATGKEYEMAWMHLFTVRNGQVTRIYGFCDNHALIQAARTDG